MTLPEILESVKSGSVSVEEAERILKKESYEEMGYAKLDTSRKARTGFAEVIYCSNKADEHLLNIFERLYREDGEVFGTRASQHQYELVKEKFPEVEYDPISRILKVEKKDKKRIGKIAVCSAGTADIPVAEEAAQTAEYFGTNVERIYDVGVSGMHRLFSRLETIQSANCVIAVAGMEGALASVMGGPKFPYPAGTFVQNEKYQNIMMAMDTTLDVNGCTYKVPCGTPEENAKLDASYEHLCKMRDELVTLNIVPPTSEWSKINPNL